jgi:hypothetical protein
MSDGSIVPPDNVLVLMFLRHDRQDMDEGIQGYIKGSKADTTVYTVI